MCETAGTAIFFYGMADGFNSDSTSCTFGGLENIVFLLYRTIEKKYPPDTELDEKKMRRLYGYLVRRGFGYSDIADTLENMNIRLVHTYSDES